jgi:DNA-binding LacI/PurR family transcriptional regulator
MPSIGRAGRGCGIAINQEWIIEGDHTLEGGIAAAEKLLDNSKLPTAVMCSNDLTAIGVLHKVYRAGLRVPEDLSIIGFDDIHMARVTIPPLTSIQMSRTELARAAVNALRAHVEKTRPQREYRIDTRLVVRESTGYPPGTMQDLRGLTASSARRMHKTARQ